MNINLPLFYIINYEIIKNIFLFFLLIFKMIRLLSSSSPNLNSISTLATFSHSKRGNFFQNEPKISNQFEEDPFLREQLRLDIPEEVLHVQII